MVIKAGSIPFGPLTLHWAAATHVGLVREGNEDAFRVVPLPDEAGLLIVVSDGMGGTAGGEVASRIVVETLTDCVGPDLAAQDRQIRYDALRGCLDRIEPAMMDRIRQDMGLFAMGATGVFASFAAGECLHLWAGDSPLYRFPGDGGTPYRTRDHSMLQTMIELGEFTPEEAFGHGLRSAITSCFGGGPQARLSIAPKFDSTKTSPFLPVEAGDLFLLCTDGLCGEVRPAALADLVQDLRHDPRALVRAAIDAALETGGADNITVVAVAVTGGGDGH
ncbi:PP2C family serine/threonine-protein phosphatase [Magnetospirillum sp. 15-1]|uniref:PP2C family protein-serine/threonine phosphatase n=1 Tax=Magnetospirillum sp. 15-1 TaxID=1979370 RepID=UPI001482F86E|nr:PP2C family serine/threonine-protein phosphatase [Magnetospirillum sp. 15-1]